MDRCDRDGGGERSIAKWQAAHVPLDESGAWLAASCDREQPSRGVEAYDAMASVAEDLRMAAVPAAEVEDDSGPRERRRKLRDLGPWPLPRPVKGFGDCIIRPDDVPARRQIHDTRIAAPA